VGSVSVAELPPHEPEFERAPPHDMAAEQCVLGGMLLSQDAIAEVIETLRAPDFYRPAHQIIYETILDLYGRGEPSDAVTISAELTKRGEIARVGGAPYLHTLISSVPTAANAGYYAKIVHERSVLRKLVEVGTRITQRGYAADGADADAILDWAEAEVLSIAEKRAGEDYLPLSEIMPGTLDEIEAIGSRGGQMVGVPTGFQDLDALTNGLHPGQMVIIAARPAVGKALSLDTPLPTPTGWTTMGEVQVGDHLLGADGRPTRVVAVTDVMAGRPCYEVLFDDGAKVTADADHQWFTDTRASRKSAQAAAAGDNRYHNQRTFASVKTTKEISATLRCEAADRRANHSVKNAAPLDLPHRTLPIPPYALGAWLGDGHGEAARTTTAGSQGSLLARLRDLGVLENKHIPQEYLRGSIAQRRELLAGLLDTDASVSGGGSVRFSTTSKAVSDGFRELVMSLGYRCRTSAKRVKGRSAASSTAWTTTFTPTDEVFGRERKRRVHAERRRPGTPKLTQRFVVGVQEVESVPVRCVQVDSVDHLYLATTSLIPTHNSTLALDLARSAAVKHGLTAAFFSLEMSRNEITMRLLSAEARVALHAMRSGTMNDDDWTRLARRMSEVSEAPLFIDDSPNMSMMEIRAKCRRLKQQHDLRLVVIDYLQLMSSGKRVESRQVEVSEFSRSLKLLAKELGVPVIALSQLNRGPEQRTDKKPMVSDLRESGSIEQDADVVILLHREDAYEKESPRAGEADLIVAKHRNGPTATVTVAFQGHYSRFVDMAQ
jgi:replicative DNA helicase